MPPKVSVKTLPEDTATAADESAPTADVFKYRLADGKIVEVGRPQGVLKLKLRNILSVEELQDPELVQITTALLSIRSYDGKPLMLNNRLVFDAFLDKFGEDKYIDDFMNHYQKFVDPKLASVIEKAVETAIKEGLSPTDLPAAVTREVMAYQRGKLQEVKK